MTVFPERSFLPRRRPLPLALALTFAAVPAAWAQSEALPQGGTVLAPVIVSETKEQAAAPAATLGPQELAPLRAATADTASLLRRVPGVTLYGAGGASSLPAIHGLADERLRLQVDGMDLLSACPNHMNPALSYLDPSQVETIQVWTGVTPVSVGGDAIGGAIVVETPKPRFAAPGQGTLVTGDAGTYYRSNGDGFGVHAAATIAGEQVSVRYLGAYAKANNYDAGGNFKEFTATGRAGHTLDRDEVGSTSYELSNHLVGLALKSGAHLVDASVAVQNVADQLYPNQRMDMLDNDSTLFNLRYLGQFDWGSLDARAYHQSVDHFMDFGEDKRYWYGTASGGPTAPNGKPCSPIGSNCAAGMPMNTESRTTGAKLTASIALSERDVLRLGGEYQHYTLDDWWPPSGAGMWPGTFWNIKNGERDRAGLFGEWETKLNERWMALAGVRYEHVTTDADPVQGYADTNGMGMMMNYQKRDAAAFNARDRKRTDDNLDFTALTRYTLDEMREFELGFARKVRSPSLYERYPWSTWTMAAVMNNFVGDGNGYIGNPDLEPEKAYTLSATIDWHAADRRWGLRFTPYLTYVDDYIDALQWDAAKNAPATTLKSNQFVVLRYENQSARLYGFDLSGKAPLARTSLGAFGFEGMLSYTKGENRDTDDGLYNIVPWRATLTLTHQLAGWSNAIDWELVSPKDDVSDARNEIETPGYGLVHLRASRDWKDLRLDVGVENLFDKLYYLPTGGAYVGQGTTMSINAVPWGIAVPGMGRSIYAAINVKF
ncbi:MAG: TonB-dependent receptor [Rhodocyclales bacterium]|nr:TonB-dependent receptor [Rhodocyclales bacterium]